MKAVFHKNYLQSWATFYKGLEYPVLNHVNGYYLLLDSDNNEVVMKDHTLRDVAIIVEDEESMKVIINVWHKDITNVAEWLYSHHYASIFASVDEAEASIYRTIYGVLKAQKEALKDNPDTDFAAYGGTGGYYVFFQWEERNPLGSSYANIDVYVDPSVAKGSRKGVHVVSNDIDTLLEWYQDYS